MALFVACSCAGGEGPGVRGWSEPGATEPAPCPAGHVVGPGGDCMPVGIQGCAEMFMEEDGLCHPSLEKCPAGTIPKFEEGCVPVGIQGCAAVFMEEDGLCHPSMAKCPEGTFAVPTEGCVPIDGPEGCGEGTWGNIPEEAGNVYVNAGYAGADGEGSQEKPFRTIAEAMEAVGDGGRIAVAEGVYDEAVTIVKDVTLEGRCPSKVRIQGVQVAYDFPAVVLVEQGANATIRGVEVGGGGIGVFAYEVEHLEIDRIHVMRASFTGVLAMGPLTTVEMSHGWIESTLPHDDHGGVGASAHGGARFAIESSALTTNRLFGAYAAMAGSRITLSQSLVADTRPIANGEAGVGIRADREAEISIDACAVTGNRFAGVEATGTGTLAHVRNSLVEKTIPEELSGALGIGLIISERARALVEGTAIIANRASGVATLGEGPTLILQDSLIKETRPASQVDEYGPGVHAQESASVTITDSSIAENAVVGVYASGHGCHVSLSGSVVEGTLPQGSTGSFGKGIEAGDGAVLEISSTAILRNHDVGVHIAKPGTVGTMTGSLIEGTLAQVSDGTFGRGLEVAFGAELTMERNALIKNHDIALFVGSADELTTASSRGDLIRGTLPSDIDSEYGMGVFCETCQLSMSSTVVNENRVAAMLLRGATTADISDILVDGVPGGRFTLQNPTATYEDVGDGILVMDGAEVNLTRAEVRNCARAGILYDSSSGTISASSATANRLGLVLQGDPRPTVSEDSSFSGNTERDRLIDGNLPIPDTPSPVP